ncbi:MAG: F0F1 ATP synthase subunit alpha [Mycoplasmataceae bacterium]|nr:F0F1 ATP synthase subunit alpha [Mycoplasmataceae bacterium]
MTKQTELKIIAIRDNIITVEGEHSYQFLEEVKFTKEVSGIVLKATSTKAFVALLKIESHFPLQVGGKATATGVQYEIEIFNNFWGSIIDIDGSSMVKGTPVKEVKKLSSRGIFEEAKPIYARKLLNEPLFTGTSAIDGLLPIGKGQKELIVGDRGTGKTGLVVTAMLAQVGTNVKNVYVAVGKKREEVIEIFNVLKSKGVMEQTIIVVAASDDTAAAKYLAPYIGASIAEYFQEQGEDTLLVLDDLSNHADAYRELSLITGVAPGREAFPGDIFFTHSRLLERCGKFTEEFGSGSITIIPIVQTLGGDISGYIPTNLISITDGQIYTSTTVFNEGRRPALEITYSVSRLGSAVQTNAMVKATAGLKRLVSEYEGQKKLSSFNSNLSAEDKDRNLKGRAFELIIDQEEYEVIDYNTSVILFLLLRNGFLSFYSFESLNEINLVKSILKVFLSKDIIGIKMAQLINKKAITDDVVQLYLKHIILPLLKYHILSENKWLRNNPEFIKAFKDIRNDGRVLLSYERRGYEKGIAYEI